ncbi:tetratricopeptide repeat protein [bacterium]|nr:tetratricopeptide repeat protein [bacterium]
MVLKFTGNKIITTLLLFALTAALAVLPTYAQDKTLARLKKISASQPNNPNAHFNLGLYYYQKGRYKQSVVVLQKVIAINSADEEALVLLGSVYLRVGKLQESERILKKVLKINPDNIDAQNSIGLVYFNQNRPDTAVRALQKSLNIQPDNLDALNNLAFVYAALNKVDAAIGIYKRIRNIDPKSAFSYECLAQLYYIQQKYSNVIKIYHQSKGKIPENAKLLNHVAFAHFYQGEIKAAYKYFSRANKLNPGEAESYFGMGLIAYKKANLDIAIKKFRQAIKLKKKYLEAYRQLAMAYEDKGEYLKALYYYRQFLKISPKDRAVKRTYRSIREKAIDYYLRKGSKAYFRNDYKSAVKYWNNVLKLDSKNITANKFIKTAKVKLAGKINEHLQQAESFLRKNKQQDAYREFRAVLKIAPKNKRAKKGMERVKLKQKEKDEIRTAQAMDSLRKGRNVKAALKDLNITLKKDPTNLIAKNMVSKVRKEQKSGTERNYRKGIDLFSKGKLREAIVSLERSLEMDQKNQGIKNLLYKARTQLRENIRALIARGIELSHAGRIPEAQEKFIKVLKLDPHNAEANEYLAKFTGKEGNVTVSKDEIKKLYYKGVSFYLDAQNRRAIEVWKKILVLDPNHQEAKSSITKAEMELKAMEKLGIKSH